MQLFEITQPETEKEIDQYIDQAKSSILGKEISPEKIAKVVQRLLRPRYGITVNAEMAIGGLDPNNVSVNGYFDMSAWDKKNNIEIVIAYHEDNEDSLIIGPDDWRILSFRIKLPDPLWSFFWLLFASRSCALNAQDLLKNDFHLFP